MTIYLVSYILGPLLLSPFSERSGRNRPLLLANTLYIGASIGCALSPTLN